MTRSSAVPGSRVTSRGETGRADADLIAFIHEFSVWWYEAGAQYYSEDCIHEDGGLEMLARKAAVLAARHAVKPMTRAAVILVLCHALDHVAMTSRRGIDPDSDDAIELLMRACMSVPK